MVGCAVGTEHQNSAPLVYHFGRIESTVGMTDGGALLSLSLPLSFLLSLLQSGRRERERESVREGLEGEEERRGSGGMVSTRARTVEILSLPKREGMVAADATPPPACVAGRRSGEWEGESGTPLEYERCREERIRENMEKMQKMGILDLALKFKSSVSGSSPASRRLQSRRSTPSPAQPTKDLPPRRSSRFQAIDSDRLVFALAIWCCIWGGGESWGLCCMWRTPF